MPADEHCIMQIYVIVTCILYTNIHTCTQIQATTNRSTHTRWSKYWHEQKQLTNNRHTKTSTSLNKGEKQHTVTNSHKESKIGRHSKKKTECNQEISVWREQKTNQGKTITMCNNVGKSEGSFTVLHNEQYKSVRHFKRFRAVWIVGSPWGTQTPHQYYLDVHFLISTSGWVVPHIFDKHQTTVSARSHI